MITSIYIKTHNVTGLKYFGITKKKDIEKYKGSGKYWKNHIKKHGYNCRTKVVRTFTNMEDCRWWCIKFSIINNIVESKDWANLMNENGLTGNVLGNKHSKVTKNKMKKSQTGLKRTEEHKKNMSKSMVGIHLGKKHTEESRLNMSKSHKGKKQKLITCPHCSKNGGISNMKGYHFDKCKLLKGIECTY